MAEDIQQQEQERRAQLNAQRSQEARQNRQKAAQEAKEADKRKKSSKNDKRKKAQASKDLDDPNPLYFSSFAAFFPIAVAQDVFPAIFDFIGIGPIINWVLWPFTWFAYWYLIVRWVPKGLKRTFWRRSLIFTIAGLIPYIGEILPEWIATTIIGYVILVRYRAMTESGLVEKLGAIKEGVN